MASKSQIERRIEKSMELIENGLSNKEIAKRLHVHRHTVERDIKRIQKEAQKTIGNKTVEDVFFQVTINFDVINRTYWEIIDATNNDRVKLRALRGLMRLNFDRIKILERLGVINKDYFLQARYSKESNVFDKAFEALEKERNEKT